MMIDCRLPGLHPGLVLAAALVASSGVSVTLSGCSEPEGTGPSGASAEPRLVVLTKPGGTGVVVVIEGDRVVFEHPEPLYSPTMVSEVERVDFDGDGMREFVFSAEPGDAGESIFVVGKRNGCWSTWGRFHASGFSSPTIRDVDGDGHPDITVVADRETGVRRTYRFHGGRFIEMPAAPRRRATNASEATEEESWANPEPWLAHHDYEGSIGDALRIGMTLSITGRRITGGYFYVRYLKDLRLEGRIDEAGRFILKEFDPNGQQTGVFVGAFCPRDSENASDTRLVLDEITGSWSRPDGTGAVPFRLSHISTLFRPPGKGRYWMAGFDNDDEVEGFAREFRKALLADNRARVVEMVRYPLTVFLHHEKSKEGTVIADKAELLKKYDRIFDAGYRRAMEDAIPHNMFAKYNGVMLSHGALWIQPVPGAPTGEGDTTRPLVTCINHPLPERP